MEEKQDRKPKYIDRAIQEENLLDSAKDFRLGWRFTFQEENDLKYTAKNIFTLIFEHGTIRPKSSKEFLTVLNSFSGLNQI